MEQYLAVIFAVGLGVGILIPLLLLYRYLPPGPIKTSEKIAYDDNKESTYECGVEPTGSARRRFSVKFFLVAMLFVVFDIEGVLIFPWAVTFKKLGMFGFVEMIVFLGVLGVGLAYVWKKGALEW
jgi:NADH-quinone oxidoreductase subunit A